WVITQEGTRQSTEVIGLLSSRKSPDKVRMIVEFIYALFNYSAGEHFSCSRYQKPQNPYPAEYNRINTGARNMSTIFCGHHPYLVARLAKNVRLLPSERSEIEWTEPDRIEVHGSAITRSPGIRVHAVANLPFRFPPELEL